MFFVTILHQQYEYWYYSLCTIMFTSCSYDINKLYQV